MKPTIKKFFVKGTRALADNVKPYGERLLAIENGIARIQKLHKRIATDDEKQEAIGKMWIMYQTIQQRMVLEQSIYMGDGNRREQNASVSMVNMGETPEENIEREMLFKPRTLLDATKYDVTHVKHISPVNFSLMAGDDSQLDYYGKQNLYRTDGVRISKEETFHQRHPAIIEMPPRSKVKRDYPDVLHRHQVGG